MVCVLVVNALLLGVTWLNVASFCVGMVCSSYIKVIVTMMMPFVVLRKFLICS